MQAVSSAEASRSRLKVRPRSFWTSAAARAVTSTLLLVRIAAATPAPPHPKPNENDAKAAYLLNLGRFVRLSRPAPARSSFEICTLGHNSIAASLEGLAVNATINSLPVRVTRLVDISAAKSCAIVFIGAEESDRVREDLAILGNPDILTVSDSPDFLTYGGMIQFVLVSNHVRFAINLDAVNRTHLILSSELLRVASSVSGKPPKGELP